MKEVLFFAWSGVLFFVSTRTHFSLGWTSKKCVLAEHATYLDRLPDCYSWPSFQNKTLFARCGNIAALPEDLSDVPRDILAMCVTGSVSTIHRNALCRFQALQYLYLEVEVQTVLPGAFHGLPHLQNLTILYDPLSFQCKNISFAQDVFLNLTSLKTLTLNNICINHIGQVDLPPSVQLQELSLQYDNINDFSMVFSVFRGMQSVHRLDLRNNYIEIVQMKLGFKQWDNIPAIFELDLSENPVSKLSPDAFSRMGLRSLILSPPPLLLNDLLHCGAGTLDNLFLRFVKKETPSTINMCYIASRFKLVSFAVTYSDLEQLSGEGLSECGSLETLDLSSNNLKYLANDILYKIPHLRVLILSQNTDLKLDLCPLSYEKLHFYSGLQVLHFSFNNVSSIKNKQFACMAHLLVLDLNSNRIETIEPLGFFGLLHLKHLDLHDNNLKLLDSLILQPVPNLLTLDIKGNSFKKLEGDQWGELKSLKEFTLDTNIMYLIPENFPHLTVLTWTLSDYIHIKSKSDISLSSVKIVTLIGLYINIDTPKGLLFQNTTELFIAFNAGIISMYQPISFYQMCPIVEKLFYSHFIGAGYYSELNFSNLIYLKYLEVWNLYSAMYNSTYNPEFLFQNLPSLQCLILENSGLKYLTFGMFQSMISLRVFVTRNDAFATLDNGVQRLFPKLKYWYLEDVTFPCNCDNTWFYTWAASTPQTFVTNFSNLICIQERTKLNFLIFLHESCEQEIEFMLFLLTSIFLLFFTSVTLLYKTCSSHFLSLMYIFYAWLNRIRGRKGKPVKYEFDAFVSYSSSDQGWILQHLIPNLEEKGPPFFKLCLHNRDFEVGKDIVDNIADSIYRSRKTICVISHNYLRSEWCSLEMRMATYRLLAEQEDVLILVFLEHVSKYQLSAYHRLAKMVKKKTYIAWPDGNEDKQMVFWENMRKAIEKTKVEDIVNC
ncbi:toll-like receptor 12 [Lissotriton helveticus]